MEVEMKMETLFERLEAEDPWLSPTPWDSIHSQSPNPNPNPNPNPTIYHTRMLSEASLVRLAMNALQGVQSSLISIKKYSATFCTTSADRTFHGIPCARDRFSSTHALGNILKSIGFSGSLVFLLNKFLNREFHQNSLVNQGFAVAIGKVLEGYLCSLETLYASISLRQSSNRDDVSSKVSSKIGCLTSIVHPEITLLEAYLHTKELRTQIEALGNICNLHNAALCFSDFAFEDTVAKADLEFRNFPRGGALLTYLYMQLKVADPAHRSILKFLFLRSCEPYCGFIRSWIYEAKIIDPYKEFIVEYIDDSMPSPGKAGVSIEFPFATIRERDGVTLPCFLKEISVPLIRAGQQIQVLMKLLELCNFIPSGDLTFEDIFPGRSGFSVHYPSYAAPLTFNKGITEAMVLARNGFYESLHKKLDNLSTKFQIRYQQLVSHGTLPVSSTLEDFLIFAPADQKNPNMDVGTAASSTTDELSSELELSCSSSSSSEEHSEPDYFPSSSLTLEEKYLSSLTFLSNGGCSEKPNKNEKALLVSSDSYGACQNYELYASKESEQSWLPTADFLTEEVSSEDHLETTPCSSSNSFNFQSLNLKNHQNFLSMDPMLTKSAFFPPSIKSRDGYFTGYVDTLTCFDFSSVVNPCTEYMEKLADRFRIKLPKVTNTDAIGVSGMDNVHSQHVEKTNLPSVSSPFKATVGSHDVGSTKVTGGSKWESMLGNSSVISGNNVGNQRQSSAVIFEMPLDFIIDKCLIQEIMLQYQYVSKLTIQLLDEGFDLQEHFLALRRYHFMEIADWADLFIMSLWHQKWYVMEANQRAPDIQGFLELALQRSSCGSDNNKGRLFVYMKGEGTMPLPTSSIGIQSFDFLGLGYRVDWPVSIVLTPSALKIYADIFSFLIQVKLVAFSLTDVWCLLKDWKNLISKNRRSDRHKREVLNYNILMKMRHQVNHFVSTLQQYIQSQLSHVSWCKFSHSLSHKVNDMMDLELLHMAYLNNSLDICFLSNETLVAGGIIQSILQCVLDFRSCLVGAREIGLDEGDMWSKLSRINISHVLSVKKMFDQKMKELHGCYLNSPKHGEFGVSRFWGYLNYNGYYSDIVGNELSHYVFSI